MEGYQLGGRRRMGGNVRGLRSRNGRYRMDRGRVRTVKEMEKPKKLHRPPRDRRAGTTGQRGARGGKVGPL